MAAKKVRILIVDDASLVRRYYRQTLEALGYAIDEALNGLEALEKVSEGRTDLLIVDVNMPQMDGLTFIRTFRRQNLPLAATPILVISTESATHDSDGARAAGANFYLSKPVGREILTEYVRLLCGGPQ